MILKIVQSHYDKYIGENRPMTRRKARTEIMMLLSEQSLAIITVFKETSRNFIIIFMSFCRILSTLCSQIVFHNVPHFGKRAGQKVQRKIAAAVQNVKPLYFLSRSFEISETN